MEQLYITTGIVTIIVICLSVIAGGLWLSLFLFGRIIKYMGYWKKTMQALRVVFDEERKAKANKK